MLLSLAALAPVILVACGGDAGGGTPVDPGPSGPASITITAGNLQSAPGGTVVAIPPAVQVRDAGGAPVSGARVTFAVTEGGGAVADAIQTTDAGGNARAGGWTLGPAGSQRLQASVSGVGPAVFEASIPPGAEQIEGSVGPGGGIIAITIDGHPFEGAKLAVPPGAYAQTTAFRFRAEAAPADLVLPAGYAIRGPVLDVRTDAGRGAELMTLEVPVTRQTGEDVVLALYDPATGALEVMPTVAQSEASVTVMTAHLNAGLLLGAAGASASAGPARQSAVGSLAKLIPISQLIPLLGTRIPLNAWPVPDHGSAAHPDGHGVAIAALEAVAPSVLTESFSNIVQPLDIPGFYAEAGPLAALHLAHQELSPQAQSMAAQVAAAVGQMPKATRDELMLRNIIANLSLSGRALPVAARTGSGSFGFLSALGGDDLTLQMRPTTAATELAMIRDASTGLQSIAFPTVAGGATVQADEVIPLSSFLVGLDKMRSLVDDLRRLGAATSPASRQAINQGLAGQAGMPDLSVQQSAFGDSWRPAGGEVVVRSPKVRLRMDLPLGGTMSFTIHLPTGAEIARSQADMEVGSIGAIQSLPPLQPTPHVLSAFQETLSGIKQVLPITIDILRAGFTVDPQRLNLEFPAYPAQLTATIEHPPQAGFRVEWDWGDGATTDYLGLTGAEHKYATIGEYQVVVTLRTPDGQHRLAVDTVRVVVGNEVWVGETTHTAVLTTGNFTRVVKATNLVFAWSPDDDPDLREYRLIRGDVEGRIWTQSGSGCPYDSGPVRQGLLPTLGDVGTIQTFVDSQYQGADPPPLEYQAQGGFGQPMTIPIQDTCDSGMINNFLVHSWLTTDIEDTSDALKWLPTADPDLLQGSYTTMSGALELTFEWQLQRTVIPWDAGG